MSVWGVEGGEIVGRTKTGLKKNTFLKAPMEVTDFKLTFEGETDPEHREQRHPVPQREHRRRGDARPAG